MTAKRDTPTFHRNHDVIVDAIRQNIQPDRVGRGLEIGSGSGQHVIGFARAWPGITWHPSDISPVNIASISAWREEATAVGVSNCMPPIHLDVMEDMPTTLGRLDVIVAINVIHIAPWAAAEGIFAIAGVSLKTDGFLYLYGPFIDRDTPTVASNLAFDARLRAEDPRWGIRALDDLDGLAETHGLSRQAAHVVPANNRVLVYARRATDAG
ncbi:MAG: DUF938 domain-containing protein [Pseudomonadota bacterium]